MKSHSKKYSHYQEYVDHQKEKTLDPVRRKIWLGSEWEIKLNGFLRVFKRHRKLLEGCKNALCLGARTGQEVAALKKKGIDAIGIDLVECPPLVIEGDIHDLQYEDESFDFVFTNIFDHALYPDKFVSEMERVLKPGGNILLHLYRGGDQDEYSEVEISDVDAEIVPLFKECEVLASRQIPLNFACMNWELVMNKSTTVGLILSD